MLLLAIDTATTSGGVALLDGERLVAEYFISGFQARSERLLPTCAMLIRDSGHKLEELGGVAVTVGPGSYTGIRIGVTVAKVMGYLLHIPLAGVITLDVLAHGAGARKDGMVCPLVPAKQDSVYWSLYDAGRGMSRVSSFRLSHIEDVLRELIELPGNILFVGDGVLVHRSRILQSLGGRAEISSSANTGLRAGVLAELGMNLIRQGAGVDAMHLEPFYLKKPEAEVRWEARYCGDAAGPQS
ncbi:MAG TPA: tRNA (adenosine(37)-N6)-threonylcarbamoyltransferase complex dimerization subunit type 1 TsaB [Firmicutes bacterium]|nr:tRNA (adenosine(37)-N6)-threonylcarbamoyltransferase complex dimerization subunit type 1 TsaB [Bacillota bacterium]